MHIAVRFFAAAVDDQVFLTGLEGDQRHMPGTAMIVDSLPAIGHERAQCAGINGFLRRRNDDDHFATTKRDECLTSEWMALNHIQAQGQ
jgi:hypothetical protein